MHQGAHRTKQPSAMLSHTKRLLKALDVDQHDYVPVLW